MLTSILSQPANKNYNANYVVSSHQFATGVSNVVIFDPKRIYQPAVNPINITQDYINEVMFINDCSMQTRQIISGYINIAINYQAKLQYSGNPGNTNVENGKWIAIYQGPVDPKVANDDTYNGALIATAQVNNELLTNVNFNKNLLINPSDASITDNGTIIPYNDQSYYYYSDLKSNQDARYYTRCKIVLLSGGPTSTPNAGWQPIYTQYTLDYTENVNLGTLVFPAVTP